MIRIMKDHCSDTIFWDGECNYTWEGLPFKVTPDIEKLSKWYEYKWDKVLNDGNISTSRLIYLDNFARMVAKGVSQLTEESVIWFSEYDQEWVKSS